MDGGNAAEAGANHEYVAGDRSVIVRSSSIFGQLRDGGFVIRCFLSNDRYFAVQYSNGILRCHRDVVWRDK